VIVTRRRGGIAVAALATDAKGVVLACPACGRKNRLPFSRLGEEGRCGACSEGLGPVEAPLEVAEEAVFDALLRETPLPLLVDFWAPWCGPCVMVAPEIEAVAASETGRLVVAKVDTDAVPALGRRFEIRSIPTMAVFVGGREVGRALGARPAAGIRQLVAQALA